MCGDLELCCEAEQSERQQREGSGMDKKQIYRIAVVQEMVGDDFYAAGYDANFFASRSDAELGIESLRESGLNADWYVVPVDVDALKPADRQRAISAGALTDEVES